MPQDQNPSPSPQRRDTEPPWVTALRQHFSGFADIHSAADFAAMSEEWAALSPEQRSFAEVYLTYLQTRALGHVYSVAFKVLRCLGNIDSNVADGAEDLEALVATLEREEDEPAPKTGEPAPAAPANPPAPVEVAPVPDPMTEPAPGPEPEPEPVEAIPVRAVKPPRRRRS